MQQSMGSDDGGDDGDDNEDSRYSSISTPSRDDIRQSKKKKVGRDHSGPELVATGVSSTWRGGGRGSHDDGADADADAKSSWNPKKRLSAIADTPQPIKGMGPEQVDRYGGDAPMPSSLQDEPPPYEEITTRAPRLSPRRMSSSSSSSFRNRSQPYLEAAVVEVGGGAALTRGVQVVEEIDATFTRPFPSPPPPPPTGEDARENLHRNDQEEDRDLPPRHREEGWLVGSLFTSKRQRNNSFLACILLVILILAIGLVSTIIRPSLDDHPIATSTTTTAPSFPPTVAPTRFTGSPTFGFTLSPTRFQPTTSPSTNVLSVAPSVNRLLIRKQEVVADLSRNVSTTPPSEALDWFLYQDEMELDVDEEDVLRQRYIVALLWFALDGPRWFPLENVQWLNATAHECTWEWIHCTNEDEGDIVAFRPTASSLQGTLPPEVGYLQGLQELAWGRQEGLEGTLPPVLVGGAVTVVEIVFAKNLTGPLPTAWGRSLQRIHLQDNSLTGSLPTEWGQFTSLERINVQNNDLTGTLPQEWALLQNLIRLQLDGNAFSGTLPAEWGNGMESLAVFTMTRARLSESLPMEWGQLASLQTLEIVESQLHGTVPSALGQLTKLEWLGLRDNQLKGTIPLELAEAVRLKSLRLENNQLEGSIPPELGNFNALESLNLDRNSLNGTIPSELGNLGASLIRLELSSNQLTGPLPTRLGECTKLVFLLASDNALTGTVPSELGKLERLEALTLSSNQLTGKIAPELASFGALSTALLVLELANNRLTGPIPDTLGGQFGKGFRLVLSQNDLTGTIPSTLGQLSRLDQMDLRWNRLEGTLPPELGNLSLLRIFRVGHNVKLGGVFPKDYGLGWTRLEFLHLVNTSITGVIPDEFCHKEVVGEKEFSVDCEQVMCTCCIPDCGGG